MPATKQAAAKKAAEEQKKGEIDAEEKAIAKLKALNDERCKRGVGPIPMSIIKGSFKKVGNDELPPERMEFEDGGNIAYKAKLSVTYNGKLNKVDAYYDDSGNLKAVALPPGLDPKKIRTDEGVKALGNFMKEIGKPYGKISPEQEFTETQLTGLILAMKHAAHPEEIDRKRMRECLQAHSVGQPLRKLSDIPDRGENLIDAVLNANGDLEQCTTALKEQLHPPQVPVVDGERNSAEQGDLVGDKASSPDAPSGVVACRA